MRTILALICLPLFFGSCAGTSQCYVPDADNTSSPPCVEGRYIPHGGNCTPLCEPPFTPYETALHCNNSVLQPGPTIHCQEPCTAPENIEGALEPSCAEGYWVPEGGSCTPRCQADRIFVGYGFPARCTNAALSPASFSCRHFFCSLPQVDLWTRSFPTSSADDYPAEPLCQSPSSYSTDGKGCTSCYGPLLTVNASMPSGGIDVGGAARLSLKFRSVGGRRLLLLPVGEVEVTWGLRGGHGTVWSTPFAASLDAFDLDSTYAADGHGVRIGEPFVSVLEQVDTGIVTGLEETHSTVSFRNPSLRPRGAEVLRGVRLSMLYVIPGCDQAREGQGSISMTVAVQSLAYNSTSCSPPTSAPSCALRCLPGFTGQPTAACHSEGGTFQLHGCRADCSAPAVWRNPGDPPDGILNAMVPSCLEGESVPYGTNCTAACLPGFTAEPKTLLCNERDFVPAQFSCRRNCRPPIGPHLAAPACEELRNVSVLPHLTNCTPRCAMGHRPYPLSPLVCNDDQLYPSTFRCEALLVPVLDVHDKHGRHWTALQAGGTAYFLLAADSEEQSVKSSAYQVLPEGQGKFKLSPTVTFSGSATDILVLAVQTSFIVIATSTRRGLGMDGIGGPSPVYRWHLANQTVEVLQDLPLRGCAQLSGATAGGRVVLLAASNTLAGTNNNQLGSSAFVWNGTTQKFQDLQQIPVPATHVVGFTFGGFEFALAATNVGLGEGQTSQVYSWRNGAFVPVLTFPTPGISAIAWAGCRTDFSFADSQGRPCHELQMQHCTDADTRDACGVLCGCEHEDPLIFVALSRYPSELLVLKLEGVEAGLGSLSFTVLQSVPTLTPFAALCPVFSESRSELFLVAAANSNSGALTAEATSFVYVWKSKRHTGFSDELEAVQSVVIKGSSTCASVKSAGIHYVILGGPGSKDSNKTASVFSLEGRYDWQVGMWRDCVPSCRHVGPEISARNRTVVCVGVPSGFLYSEDLCLASRPAIEDQCQVPMCGALFPYKWATGPWGPCEGECGTGLRQHIVECRTTVENSSVVSTAFCESSEALISGLAQPQTEGHCPLGPCSSFRLINRATLRRQWHVTELHFYVDDECKQMMQGVPFSAGYCELCQCKNATGHWGTCGPELAFDGHVPYEAADGQVAAGTAWISECGSIARCSAGETWIGVHTYTVQNVRCARIMQSGDEQHAAREISLESFDRAQGTWIPITEWADVVAGEWMSLTVPRLCNSLLDCLGNGIVRGLPAACVCTCQPGYTGPQCQYCDVGFEGYPICQPRHQWSDGWRLMALEVPPGRTWHVSDVTLHTDRSCTDASRLGASDIQSYNGSYQGTLGPERAFDGAGEGTTWIASECAGSDLSSCPNGPPWIGVRLRSLKAVTCLRILQGHSDFAIDTIALDLWNSSGVNGGYWHRVRSWSSVLLARVEGYTPLRLVCNDGIPVGNELMHDCDTEKLPWQKCTAWCREGYSGTPQTFLCWDEYAFRGVLPACEANECTQGIPAGQGVTVDECLGLKTDQRCKATCGSGFVGAAVKYVCGSDGKYREERTGQFGVMPACTEGVPGLVDASHATLPIPQVCHLASIAVLPILLGLL